jgi:hypothetical protein
MRIVEQHFSGALRKQASARRKARGSASGHAFRAKMI